MARLWRRRRAGLAALSTPGVCLSLVIGCASTPLPPPRPAAETAPTPSTTPGAAAESGPTTQVTLSISAPTGTRRPCSRFVVAVEGCEPLDLGSYCGTISEVEDARIGMLNLQGASEEHPGPADLLWTFRALRSGDTLSFMRLDMTRARSDWLEVAAVRVPATGAIVTEISWPAETAPLPAD